MLLALTAAGLVIGACYWMRGSKGGGMTEFAGERPINPEDVALPDGYAIEAVATGLTFPTGVAFDEAGGVYVVESGYSYGEVTDTSRLLRIEPGGGTSVIASSSGNGPWNGVVGHEGAFYVAEGGEYLGGRILRVTPDGQITILADSLPSIGDHHTNGPVVGPDGAIYFGQGTATNSAVVGEDNATFGWLERHPDFHDTPCRDITLSGVNFESMDPLNGGRTTTGAYSPFGTPTTEGQVIRGRVPCNGAILRVPLDGGAIELVAWGLRNPYGLAFSPDGRLYATDNGYDERGSRRVFGSGDYLWRIEEGAWYGWPDFAGGRPFFDDDIRPVLASAPGEPPDPIAVFGVHSSADGFDFSRSGAFGHVGQAFVALLGDMSPPVGKVLSPVGFKVVRVDVESGVVEDFAVNRGDTNGPASWLGSGGLERPVAARFDPAGAALYVVDFGVMTMTERGPEPRKGTGVLWRITRR
ncbi:MAG TPA: PQQ-dependent sugar dehydrogenase [Gemmatimonadota bacterium]|nr:PQQ-dependent sugar dehydrogenase [Gemmatimonadota bacterium]